MQNIFNWFIGNLKFIKPQWEVRDKATISYTIKMNTRRVEVTLIMEHKHFLQRVKHDDTRKCIADAINTTDELIEYIKSSFPQSNE
jgi:hypothetical protein